jgi:hypothetical protein
VPTISHPHTNERGQRIRSGGMTLVNCKPGCEAEFRSASHESVIHDQLRVHGWQVGESKIDAKKVFTYRCPACHIVEHGVMSGDALPAKKLQSGKEMKAQGRASHDGGDS